MITGVVDNKTYVFFSSPYSVYLSITYKFEEIHDILDKLGDSLNVIRDMAESINLKSNF